MSFLWLFAGIFIFSGVCSLYDGREKSIIDQNKEPHFFVEMVIGGSLFGDKCDVSRDVDY